MSNDLSPLSGPVDASGEPNSPLVEALKDAVQTARHYYMLWHDDPWKERLSKWEAALAAAAVPSPPAQPVVFLSDVPLAAGLLLTLKAECEAQHARAEKAEAELAQLRALPPSSPVADSPTEAGFELIRRLTDALEQRLGDYEDTPILLLEASAYIRQRLPAPSPSAGANKENETEKI